MSARMTAEAAVIPDEERYFHMAAVAYGPLLAAGTVLPSGKIAPVFYSACPECEIAVEWQTQDEAKQDADKHNRDVHRIVYATPVECRPWCEYQDGHPESLDRSDQFCATPSLRVEIPQERNEHDEPGTYDVYATQEPDEDEPWLVVSVDEGDSPKMNVAQAHQLVEALQLTLGLVETAR